MVNYNKNDPNQRQLEFKYPSSSMFSMTSPDTQDPLHSSSALSGSSGVLLTNGNWAFSTGGKS